jgi:D-xylono/L-arabinono-1,4-lactonase
MLSRRRMLATCGGVAAGAAGCTDILKGQAVAEPIEPELVADTQCQIGENPLWHPKLKRLLFLDIAAGEVWAYDPATHSHRLFSKGPVTGTMLLNDDWTMLLLQDGRASILGLDGGQRVIANNLCPENERFNDGIVDPEGRVYGGAYGGNGKLIRFDLDGSRHVMADNIGIPNGLGFTRDRRRIYFTDSLARNLYIFDYDRRTGNLSNQKVFATIPAGEGVPDGMAIDSDGNVWTAIWFGARVKRYAPDGRLVSEIHFPVRQTSAPEFGGDDLSDLYVTTAGISGGEEIAPPGYDFSRPRGGGLYRVRGTGSRGVPKYRSRVRWPGA